MFTPEEKATILAALRYWQSEGWRSEEHYPDIASDGGTLVPLDSEAIDELCARINT